MLSRLCPCPGDAVEHGRCVGEVEGAADARAAGRVPSTGARWASRAISLMLVARSVIATASNASTVPGRARQLAFSAECRRLGLREW